MYPVPAFCDPLRQGGMVRGVLRTVHKFDLHGIGNQDLATEPVYNTIVRDLRLIWGIPAGLVF